MKIPPKKTGPPKHLPPDAITIVTSAGNIVKATTLSRCNLTQTIQKLEGGDEYVVISTGEVREAQHTENRAESMDSARKTFQKLAMLINANTTVPTHCRFITLTYRENMKSTQKLYHDFVLFFKRCRYYCEKQGYGKPEYIAVAEPQARGAWHLHVILIFPKRAPFIPNDTLADLWGHGFVHIRSIDNVDNVGAYLTAYLADIELPEGDLESLQLPKGNFPIVERQIDGKTKRFIKGGRLHMYPTGMNIYRCSKGVKRPAVQKMTMEQANDFTGKMVQTYEKTIEYASKDNEFETTIYTRYFNRVREGNTAKGYYSKVFGHMDKLLPKKPKPPTPPVQPPPEPVPDYDFDDEISDENFQALMHQRNTEPAEPPEWAKE